MASTVALIIVINLNQGDPRDVRVIRSKKRYENWISMGSQEETPPYWKFGATRSDMGKIFVLIGAVSLFLSCCLASGEKINILLTGHFQDHSNQLPKFFREEPIIEYTGVPTRGVKGGMEVLMKFIRQYFPRSYQEMKEYDFIFLNSPEYYVFTTKQDKWMHDAVLEGAGGFNDASVFSVITQIHGAWAASLLQQAFPNDAPAVVARGGGGESPLNYFAVVINRNFPDPVLTPFIPYGVEQVPGDCSRYVIPRETAGTLAWQVGNFPGHGKVPFIVVWDYGEGRTVTTGSCLHATGGWFSRPQSSSDNQYAAEIFMNLIFYCTDRNLIQDVEVFHRLKSTFREFRNKMAILISLKDFVERFGANTHKVQQKIWDLEIMEEKARNHYLNQEFVECESTMNQAFDYFSEAEEAAKKLKESALLWVYVIEWAVTTSVLLISSYILWTLMVRRRLYQAVRTTKMQES